MRLDLTLMQIEAVKTMLANDFDEDERLRLDAIEGETDAFELARKLIHAIEEEDGAVASLSEQIASRQARKARADKRKAGYRQAITAIMQCGKLDKLPLPEATITLRDGKDKLAIVDADAVPDDYQVVTRSPDKRAINAAFEDAAELPNWLIRESGAPTLTVRLK